MNSLCIEAKFVSKTKYRAVTEIWKMESLKLPSHFDFGDFDRFDIKRSTFISTSDTESSHERSFSGNGASKLYVKSI